MKIIDLIYDYIGEAFQKVNDNFTEVQNSLGGKSSTTHNHDGLYFGTTNHTKAIHDNMGIDAGSVGGQTLGGLDTKYVNRVDHTKAAHDTLGINAASVSGFGIGAIAKDINGTDLNDLRLTGFFQGHRGVGGVTNAPPQITGEMSWFYLTHIEHNLYWSVQTLHDFNNVARYSRESRDSGAGVRIWGAWKRIPFLDDVWHPSNDGAGSGLDADTVDGLDSESFLDFTNEARNIALTGGGDISLISGRLKWSDRFLLLPFSEAGPGTANANYINLLMPTSGVLDHTGAERATVDGISIVGWESLWITYTRNAASANLVWRVIPYQDPLNDEFFGREDAIRLAVRNGDTSNLAVYLRNGDVVPAGRTLLAGKGLSTIKTDIYTTPGLYTWTKPAGCVSIDAMVISGGGGGGSGRRGAAATVRCGGGGGGGGAKTMISVPASVVGATEEILVGAGGTGGAAVTIDDTNGNAGGIGQTSRFGTHNPNLAAALQPGGGAGGTASTGTNGYAGTGTLGPGGPGGAASTTGGAGGNGGTSFGGAGGAGAGGGITAADAVSGGGWGGAAIGTIWANTVVGTAGANGLSGMNARIDSGNGGQGAQGGGSSITAAAGNGGNGGFYGAGGSGGGASLNGFNSGAGGNGANGMVIIISHMGVV